MNKRQEYRDFIIELAKLFRPQVYVEIGARFGYVFNEISKIARRSIAIDLVELNHIERSEGVSCYQMSSDSFVNTGLLEGLEIDLLFIDADHRYEAVLNDFVNYAPYVRPDKGLILLHDTYPVNKRLLADDRCSDAWKVAKQIHNDKNYEIVTLPGPWAGLSIVRKTNQKHGWMDK